MNQLEQPCRWWIGKENITLIVVVLVIGVFHLLTLREGQEWGDDFALYVGHARNLAEGRPYGDTGYVYNPHYPSIATRTYPPVFPIVLTPVYCLFGLDLIAMKAFVLLVFMASLWVIGLVFRRHLSFRYSLVCVVVIGLNPQIWQIKDRLLSEMPYMLFLYLSLLLFEKAHGVKEKNRWRLTWAILAGITAFLAYGTRSPGILLIPSILIYHFATRQVGQITIAVVGAYSASFLLQGLLLPLDTSAGDQLVYDLPLFASISVSLVKAQGSFLSNGYNDIVQRALYLPILALAIIGFLCRLRRISVYEPFVVLSFLLLAVWPYAEWNSRYLLPLLPLFVFYVCIGIHQIASIFVWRLEHSIAVGLAMMVFLSYAFNYSQKSFGPIQEGVSMPESLELFQYVRSNSNPEDVFVFPRPKALALYTRRNTSALHNARSSRELWAYLDSICATHVVLARNQFKVSQEGLNLLVKKNRNRFQLVFKNPRFIVYEILPFKSTGYSIH